MSISILSRKLLQYSKILPTALKLNYIYHFSKKIDDEKLIQHAQFVHHEVPIRLAHCAVKLENMPYDLPNISSVRNIVNLYQSSFNTILNTKKPTTKEECINISNILSNIKYKHSDLQLDLGRGIQEWKKIYPDKEYNIDYFLNEFYMSRISIRTLMGQYISLEKTGSGIIKKCNPKHIITDAISNISSMTMDYISEFPNINIHSEKEIEFTYIPSHIYYIVFEILKNSVRATVEKANKNESDMNDINIYISEGKTDLIIKISDFGGGFCRDELKDILKYSYTTVKQPENSKLDNSYMIAGYGYGIPLSRIYCKYFNGDLKIIPYDGIGTDVLIFINKLGNQNESVF